MESLNSFNAYSKVDEADHRQFRRQTRRRLIIIIISSVLLICVIMAAVAGTLIHKKNSSSSSSSSTSPNPTSSSLKSVCSVTQYPDSCFSSISPLDHDNTADSEIIFKLSLRVAIDELSKFAKVPSDLIAKSNDSRVKAALTVCEIVLDDAVDHLNDSISLIEVRSGEKIIDDLKTWLSTTITDQETCLDALSEINSTILPDFKSSMRNSTEFASNSLAIVTKIVSLLSKFRSPFHRKLLGFGTGIGEARSGSEFPDWISSGDRRLLQEANPVPDVTVAKDGTGDYETITAAVAAVANFSTARFVIYVKEGVYVENVVLDKSKWNVMMYGDGKKKSVVSGSLNYVDMTPTFSTATVGVSGQGFIAKDMGFKNTAGPIKQQGVALRSSSDFSVFYNCSFDAYQDTLYTHTNRQFYRECDITGTVDFIFGTSTVVFQNCNIQPRQPLPTQFNTITAQGNSDPNLNSGISIQKSTFSPFDNLTAATFLGRPWKNFSTTVVMQSDIGSFLDPMGWVGWVRNTVPPDTVFYAEYENTGPGSGLDKRLKWAGYRPNLTDVEAGKFTVETFLHGSQWLPQTSVTFDANL